MPAFDELTKRQRLPVLRTVAIETLRDAYGIEPTRVRLLSLSFNTLFRVDRADGAPVVLRVGARQRIHAPEIELVEAAWLDRIGDDLGWRVPRCVAARDGQVMVEANHPAVPRPIPCSLFTWVGGHPIEAGFDAEAARMIGSLLARLHRHAATLATDRTGPMAPSVMTDSMAAALRADRVVYFGDVGQVATCPAGEGALLSEAIDRGRRFLSDLWAGSGPPHLLHGDFGPSNVLRHRGTFTPVDFQDLQLGHAVQDVGLTVADLLDEQADPSVVSSFRVAVEATGGVVISDDQVAAFGALRSLNLIGFCLASPRPGLEPTIEQSVLTIRRWMYDS